MRKLFGTAVLLLCLAPLHAQQTTTFGGTGGTAATLADDTANPSVLSYGAFALIWDGATWDRWTGNVTSTTLATETTLAAINTKIPASPATDRTTAAAPFALRLSDGTNFYNGATETTAAAILALLPAGGITGDVAKGAAFSQNPAGIGIEARTTRNTAVDSGDVIPPVATKTGEQVAFPACIPETMTSGAPVAITGTTSTQIIAAPGAGLALMIGHISAFNSHATVATELFFEANSGGTIVFRSYCPAVSGCFVAPFPVPLLLAANTGLFADPQTTGANILVNATACIIAN